MVESEWQQKGHVPLTPLRETTLKNVPTQFGSTKENLKDTISSIGCKPKPKSLRKKGLAPKKEGQAKASFEKQ